MQGAITERTQSNSLTKTINHFALSAASRWICFFGRTLSQAYRIKHVMPGKGEIAVQGEAETEPVESLGLGHAPFAGMTYLRV
jgi:hypothetical protein